MVIRDTRDLSPTKIDRMIRRMLVLSESRGKESSGLAIQLGGEILILKRPLPASELICTTAYKNLLKEVGDKISKANTHSLTIIGHARLVTNGKMEHNVNNQPVIKEGVIAVHNGIIVNDGEIWDKNPSLVRQYEVDTESILALLKKNLDSGKDVISAAKSVYQTIEGTASIACMFEENLALLLATNNGSMYISTSSDRRATFFASEFLILGRFVNDSSIMKMYGRMSVGQVPAGSGRVVNLANNEIRSFSLRREAEDFEETYNGANKILIREYEDVASSGLPHQSEVPSAKHDFTLWDKEFEKNKQIISRLRRCTKCILTETMPYIEFDDLGVCNYCKNYTRVTHKDEKELERVLRLNRGVDTHGDCVVMFSGGRDSSYGLHLLKTKYNLRPIAYSYDWGMITDLGRRNQARMCGMLGVEHILVSADIRKKRENIRKNVLAWLKKPDLGIIPLFMAGDKQYFFYANKLRRQMRVPNMILLSNPYEKTEFKTGFCGIRPKKHLYRLSVLNSVLLLKYYFFQFIKNPAYINGSLLDTLWAYISYYFTPHNYLHLFDFVVWNEEKLNTVLREKYNWELASDTETTWRIGDGTAPFYNYIYYTIAGFTENDTFRSNQVREGAITRENAIELAERDNRPRWESMRWYFDTIGIDMSSTIMRINEIPKLYGNKQ